MLIDKQSVILSVNKGWNSDMCNVHFIPLKPWFVSTFTITICLFYIRDCDVLKKWVKMHLSKFSSAI